jgi:hypothetical protein
MAGTAAAGAPVVHRPQGVKRIEVALTCTAGGVVDEAVIGEAYGRIVGVLYDGGLDASAVVTIKAKPGAASLVSVPVIAYTTGTEGTPVFFRPTDIVTTDAGADIAASANAVGVNRDIFVAGKLTITVASGGASETGKFALIIDETPVPPTFDLPLTV